MQKETLHEMIWLIRVYRNTQNAYRTEKDENKRTAHLNELKKAGKEADAACESIRANYLENPDYKGFEIMLAGKIYLAYSKYRNSLFDYLKKKTEHNLFALKEAEKNFNTSFNAVAEAAGKL